MPASESLALILTACERLRRLPGPRWQQSPRPPLGALAVGSAPQAGAGTLAAQVRASVQELMAHDARVRHVEWFEPEVPAFSLPDVLAALARSVADAGDGSDAQALEAIAQRARDW